MNKIIISNRQLFAFTSLFVCGSATLVIAASAATLARQDAWIAGIVAIIFGLATLWITSYLGGLYPNKTIIEVIQLLMGKWIGGFVIINYIFMCFVATCQIIWYVGNFFTTTYMPETPTYAITVMFGVALIIAIMYGLEVITRASEIFFIIVCLVFIASMGLVAPNMKVNNLLPVMEKGITPILKGSIALFAFSGAQMVLLNIIYPVNIKDMKSARRALFKGFLFGMGIILITILMALLVLGPSITANARFPSFLLAKEINVGIILTRLEALTILSWLLTIFIIALLYFYNGILGIAQLIGINNYKRIVIPYGLLQIVVAEFIYDNVPYQMDWDSNVWPAYIFTFGFVLPIVLLVIAKIRSRIYKMQNK